MSQQLRRAVRAAIRELLSDGHARTSVECTSALCPPSQDSQEPYCCIVLRELYVMLALGEIINKHEGYTLVPDVLYIALSVHSGVYTISADVGHLKQPMTGATGRYYDLKNIKVFYGNKEVPVDPADIRNDYISDLTSEYDRLARSPTKTNL